LLTDEDAAFKAALIRIHAPLCHAFQGRICERRGSYEYD
jgi:hypothetical protein